MRCGLCCRSSWGLDCLKRDEETFKRTMCGGRVRGCVWGRRGRAPWLSSPSPWHSVIPAAVATGIAPLRLPACLPVLPASLLSPGITPEMIDSQLQHCPGCSSLTNPLRPEDNIRRQMGWSWAVIRDSMLLTPWVCSVLQVEWSYRAGCQHCS